VSFELDRRHVVERLVDPPVVEPVDVFQCLPFDVLDVAPGPLAVDEFGLEEAVEALGQRIIVAVALGPDRRDDLRLTESLGVTNAEVLTRFNRWKQHLLVEVIVSALREPPLASSIQESFGVAC